MFRVEQYKLGQVGKQEYFFFYKCNKMFRVARKMREGRETGNTHIFFVWPNCHVLTSTNPCINKAILELLIHGFVVLRISIHVLSQNLTSSVMCTVANVISWCQNDGIICPTSGIFKMLTCNVPFCAIVGTRKKRSFLKHFLQSFRVKKCFMQ